MSNKRSSRQQKSSVMQKRDEGNLGQKEARLEKEKASELTRMGEKTPFVALACLGLAPFILQMA